MRSVWAAILLCGVLLLPAGQAVPTRAAQCLEISCADDLRALSRRVSLGDSLFGQTVFLTQDIDGVGYFLPIGSALHPFEGTFDGGGHTLSGLTVDGYLPCSGLFGCVGRAGTVRDLTLSDCLVSGRRYTGAVAGLCAGRMERCAVQNSLVRCLDDAPDYAATGALTGCLSGTLRLCEASACSVDGPGHLGGLVGRLYVGGARLCRFEGTVEGAPVRAAFSARAESTPCSLPYPSGGTPEHPPF